MTMRNQQTRVLAEVIKAAMIAQNRSLLSLAEATGVPEPTLRRRLRGLTSFAVDELNAIAAELGTTASALMAAAESEAA